jgi:hypothetical protein
MGADFFHLRLPPGWAAKSLVAICNVAGSNVIAVDAKYRAGDSVQISSIQVNDDD